MAAVAGAVAGGAPLVVEAAESPVVAQLDLLGPVGSEEFGQSVTVLTNGNYAVIDSGWPDEDNQNRLGAAHLYDGITNTVISSLVGIRDGEVVALSNGNFVVDSKRSRGTVTWVNGVTGIDGPVTGANSLVGTGTDGEVIALSNGNYVVASGSWDNGAATDAGAVTWGGRGHGYLWSGHCGQQPGRDYRQRCSW